MMKRTSIAALVLCLSMMVAGAAQAAVPKNNITVQPIGFLFGNGNLEYEAALGDTTAIAGRINYSAWNIGDWSTSAIGGGLSYRFFPVSKQAPRGFWVGPGADILIISSTYEDDTASSTFISVGGDLGYKWIWGEEVGFVLCPSISLRYVSGSLSVGDNELPFGGFGFGLGLALGLAF
ncbi:DUF3575 domain-containing protein [candidate division FCPU426 bacterium]|nr:DUF3575 domain-containing protein [candidate division FCPU426 bacterium]